MKENKKTNQTKKNPHQKHPQHQNTTMLQIQCSRSISKQTEPQTWIYAVALHIPLLEKTEAITTESKVLALLKSLAKFTLNFQWARISLFQDTAKQQGIHSLKTALDIH